MQDDQNFFKYKGGQSGKHDRVENYPEYLRLRWNVVGTHLACSADDSTVTVWQRSLGPQAFTKLAHLKSTGERQSN